MPPIKADFGQLRQSFVNIALNACEAMNKGGTLTVVSTARGRPSSRSASADTGPGHRAREPLAHPRPVLHDEGEGHRARPVGGLRHHRPPRRDDRHQERGGTRHDGDRAAAGRDGLPRRLRQPDGGSRAGTRTARSGASGRLPVVDRRRAGGSRPPGHGAPAGGAGVPGGRARLARARAPGRFVRRAPPAALLHPDPEVAARGEARRTRRRWSGITDVDLFIPILTFVYGEAQLGGHGGGRLDRPAARRRRVPPRPGAC